MTVPPFLLAAFFDWRTWLFVGVLAGAGWIHHDGVMRERAKTAAAVAQFEAVKAAKEAAAIKSASAIKEALSGRKIEIRTVTNTIIKEVPTYVSSRADAACIVPRGFVQLYDAAARLSGFPAATSESLDAPSGIPLSNVSRTTATNFDACHSAAAEANAWRRWWTEQNAIAARKTP